MAKTIYYFVSFYSVSCESGLNGSLETIEKFTKRQGQTHKGLKNRRINPEMAREVKKRLKKPAQKAQSQLVTCPNGTSSCACLEVTGFGGARARTGGAEIAVGTANPQPYME